MSKDPDFMLIEAGMDLGLYLFATMLAEGKFNVSQKGWEILARHCAEQIESSIGMPAEDLALRVQPTVSEMLKRAEEAQ